MEWLLEKELFIGLNEKLRNKFMITNNEKQKALEALKEIGQTLEGIKDLFPKIPKSTRLKFLDRLHPDNPVETLKRINGIIKNYNEDNAEMKLENLLKFLSANLKKKK